MKHWPIRAILMGPELYPQITQIPRIQKETEEEGRGRGHCWRLDSNRPRTHPAWLLFGFSAF